MGSIHLIKYCRPNDQGKTTRIPVIFGLKDYDYKSHIQDLVLNPLQFRYGVDIKVPKYHSLQRIGRVIFLFDVFD